MNFAPGGYIPPLPDDGDSVRAVLSDGEVRMSADAVKRYGAAFFAKIGGISAANVHPLPDDDVIVHSGPAERADVTGLPNLFAQSPRYSWRFIACGVAVTYRTDAAGLQLSGQVVSRPMTFGDPATLVQLVDEHGRVVASVRAVPDETTLRHSHTASWRDNLAGETHMPSLTDGCWCAPAGVGRHVNEDGSPC